jgi:hypothetical protein
MPALANFLRRLADQLAPPPVADTARGTTHGAVTATAAVASSTFKFTPPTSERIDTYRDMLTIDATMPEGSRALDVLADNAVNGEQGSDDYFNVVFTAESRLAKAATRVTDDLLRRTRLRELAYPIARDLLKYGDCFLQPVLDDTPRIVRLIVMPPETMKRNEDATGRLLRGHVEGEWAFEQRDEANKFLAGFYPWQIIHLRWNRAANGLYGVPLLNAARPAWKKLQAMEEALVINWLTRAFARLVFELDATGKTPEEAMAYARAFMKELTTRQVAFGQRGIERLTVAKDIAITNSYENRGGRYLPGLNKVSTLDTSNTAYWNVEAIEYWRNKFLSATGVPKAHLGLEKDINAKSTLEWQDMRFVKTIRRIQSTLSEGFRHLIDLELLLHDIALEAVPYRLQWPDPATSDELTRAQTLNSFADAAVKLDGLGLLDPEMLFVQFLGLSPQEYRQAATRFRPRELPDAEPEPGPDAEPEPGPDAEPAE